MLDPQAALEILRDTQVIDGKVVDCKSAVPRESLATKPLLVQPARVEEADYRVARSLQGCKKLFVGGLPQPITDFEFKEFFAQFGEIEDSVVLYDRETGKARGFGFVTFRRAESLDLCLLHPEANIIKGKWVEVKRATPREQMQPSQFFMPPYGTDDRLDYPYSSLINEVLREDN
jgi:RNA-binding protein Musashi